MSSRRTLILIAAIAVGALAAFAIFNYVGGIEDRANEDIERVSVFRVERDIPQGLTGQEACDQGYIDTDALIPREFFPPNAVEDCETILTKRAVATIPANQVLVHNMFVDAQTSQITNARRIETGRVAITISVDDVRGVAGLVVPGDFVNMMAVTDGAESCGAAAGATPEGEAPAAEAPTGPAALFCSPAMMVYQGVRVLFVDRSPIPLPGEQVAAGTDGTDPAAVVNSGLLTLSVPPAAAQIIASVGADQWYLTLLPPDYTPTAVPALDPAPALLPGQDPSQLTPCGPDGCSDEDTP